MIQALPYQTVFEAQARARRATQLLFALVLFIYTAIFNLAVFICIWLYQVFNVTHGLQHRVHTYGLLTTHDFWVVAAAATSLALMLGWIHFAAARNQPLERLLKLLGAEEADPLDSYHGRFLNVVQEAEAATGIKPIRAVIIPDMGLNAFSLDNGRGEAVIGITEGLLGRLDRSELTAVVSHEAAHLAHKDSELTTTLYSLTAVFAKLAKLFGNFRYLGRMRFRSRGGGAGLALILLMQLVLWALSAVGCALTRILYLAISRNREYLADAHAAHMCKDPLSLAEALNKIAGSSRGNFAQADGLATVFIVSPRLSFLDEMEGAWADLFSTHPPVQKRMKKLLDWAKVNLDAIKKKAPGRSESTFLYKDEKGWQGPASPQEMMMQGLLLPETWVAPLGTNEIGHATDYAELVTLLNNGEARKGNAARGRCPRCKVTGLIETEYEGTFVLRCRFCQGHLLKKGVLERMIVRHEKAFSDDAILKTREVWLSQHRKKLKASCPWPHTKCPFCEGQMLKSFHTLHTRVVIDRCLTCGAIWCDSGELEMIQIIVEKQTVFASHKHTQIKQV